MVDWVIISFYLLVMLGVSIYYGLNTKTMRDYAVANKNYSTPILVAAIIGVNLGANSTIGLSQQIISIGLLGLAPYLAAVVGLLLSAQLIAPGISKLKEAISVGDVMAHFYGNQGRILTGIAVFTSCIVSVSIQILGIGYLLQYLLEISPNTALVIGCGLIVACSALGGIKTVILTDIVQMTMLVVIIPMLCNLALKQMGSPQTLFSQIPTSHFFLAENSVTNLEYLSWALILLIPASHPAVFQRCLLANNEKQLKSALRLNSLIALLVYLTSAFLGFFILVVKPNLNPNLAFPYLIYTLLPEGLKGVALVGILALVTSMGDSLLNIAGVALVRDTLKPSFIKKQLSDKAELKLTRWITLFSGFIAILIALYSSSSIPRIATASRFLWIPMIVFPLLAGLLGFAVSRRSFILGATSGFVTTVIWFFFIRKHVGFNGVFVGFIVNGLVFSINHAYENRHTLRLSQEAPTKSIKSSLLEHWRRTFIFVRDLIASTRMDSAKTPYAAFGIFAGFMCTMPYLGWQNSHKELLPCTIIFRFLGGFFSFFLLLRDRWPQKLKTYLPLYWYAVLLYTLSFLTMFMALDTNFSWRSLSEMLIGFFLLAVLVDWLSFLLIMGAGTLLAVGAYAFIGDIFGVSMNTSNLDWAVYVCGLIAAIGVVFSRSKENETRNQLDTIRHQGSYIAHEASAPLVSIAINAQGLSHHLPTLIAGYEAARRARVPMKEIPEFQLEILKNIPEQINNISKTSLAAIGTLLTQIKGTAEHNSERCLVSQCIENALHTYPFLPHERTLITWEKNEDFEVPIQQEMLIHVLYNLIKNSLYQIAKDKRGEIKIWTEQDNQENRIYFKDTASGIEESEISLIFKPSYTTKKEGNGLGLAFSKQTIKSAGGQILCHSQKGQYVEFVLIFPTPIGI